VHVKAVSLFAGIGGFDLALERNGIEVVASVEWDKHAQSVLKNRFPNSQIFGNIQEVTGEQLINAGFDPRNGIITGGFPCQDLSVAGKRAGLAGNRSGLFWEILPSLMKPKRSISSWKMSRITFLKQRSRHGSCHLSVGTTRVWPPTGFLTLNTLEYHKEERRVFIVGSLGDNGRTPAEILAIAECRSGILRRAENRAKVLPPLLMETCNSWHTPSKRSQRNRSNFCRGK